ADRDIGDRLTIKTESGVERTLKISGTVHAAGLPPSWMEHHVTAFVSWNSLLRSNKNDESAQLRFIVAEHANDARHIAKVADRVRTTLRNAGHKVTRITVPDPGRHPHADQMDTFLFILGAFGLLTLILSAVLVANMIHALLTEQIRQIGVMKAIGARTSQIIGIYLGQVLFLAAIALAIGLIFGIVAGRAYVRWAVTMLNATVTSGAIPLWSLAIQIATGLLVPMIVALVPVLRASR